MLTSGMAEVTSVFLGRATPSYLDKGTYAYYIVFQVIKFVW